MKEIFKKVKGFEKYEISNFGRVRNSRGKILLGGKSTCGYLYIRISSKGVVKNFFIHRLVGSVFIGWLFDKKTNVCHKDDNKENNFVENLFLGTHKDNMQDMLKKGRHKAPYLFGINNVRSKKVKVFTKENVFIKEFESCGIASKELSISNVLISQNCNGKIKTAGGFIFKFT